VEAGLYSAAALFALKKAPHRDQALTMTALQTMGTALTAIALGVGSWFATEFLARPIRKFFDLRGEIIQKMTLYANVRARHKEIDEITMATYELLDEEEKRLEEAQSSIRDLASRMRSFAQNEASAVRLLKLLGYEPYEISTALFGVSNTFDTYGQGKHTSKKKLAEALRVDPF
jgi:hypothetical protein